MRERLTEVRRYAQTKTNPWVVDILATHTASDGYVRPDGTAGMIYKYENKTNAEAAETLYLAKNAGKHNGIETSARMSTCGDCEHFLGESVPCVKKDVYRPKAQEPIGLCVDFSPKKSAEGTKDTNPKDIIGMRKAPLSTLPCPVLFEMGLGMLEGARKYGRHNYRAMGVSATVYYDATQHHLMQWWEGEDIDQDSGLNHITKAMTALMVLRDSMLMGNWKDDRPLRNPIDRNSLDAKAADIIDKYPDCVEPYLEMNKDFDRIK